MNFYAGIGIIWEFHNNNISLSLHNYEVCSLSIAILLLWVPQDMTLKKQS